ncbi:hypothetical protein BD410DRAFT_834227 [Rickenella mellea]|uniref:Cell wall protein n=1 Tax=Rickenella mellea TaxID=50990 RepID=A0A4R5XI77_9AGAM|nr:hypothetical protein BD410DRAFT_834227 [Rickenella mellea]
MHANTAVLILALTAVSPALSAPLSLGTLAKEAGKGLVTGAGLAGVVDGVESLLGSGSTTSSKRELSSEDIALLKRAVGLGTLAKEIGKGLVTGAGLAGVVDGVETLVGGSGSTTTSKRELSAEDIALLKRAVGLGALAKEIGKGLVTGAGLAGVVDGVETLVGGSSSSKRAIITTPEGPCSDIDGQVACPAVTGPITELSTRSLLSEIENALKDAGSVVGGIVKREPLLPPCSDFEGIGITGLGPACSETSVSARSVLSKLLPAAEESVEDILKKAVAGGAAAGVGGAAVDAAAGSNSKREPLSLGPVGKLILGTGASIATSSVVEDAINAVTGQSTKREINARSLLSDIENDAGDVLKKAESVVGGIVKREINARSLLGDIENDAGDVLKKAESVVGGIVKREPFVICPTVAPKNVGVGAACIPASEANSLPLLSTRSVLSKLLPAAEEGVDDILKKAVAGGAAAGVAGAAVDTAAGTTSSKRELTDEQLIALMFAGGNDGSVQKREPLSLGPIGKLILGAGASIATSGVVGEAIDAVTKREMDVRSVLSKLLPAAEEGVDDILKKALAGGAAAGVAGAAVDTAAGTTSKREIDVRSVLSKLLPAAEEGVDDILKKAVAGGAAAGAAGAAVDTAAGTTSKREPLFRGNGNVPVTVGVQPNGVIDPKSLNDLD